MGNFIVGILGWCTGIIVWGLNGKLFESYFLDKIVPVDISIVYWGMAFILIGHITSGSKTEAEWEEIQDRSYEDSLKLILWDQSMGTAILIFSLITYLIVG